MKDLSRAKWLLSGAVVTTLAAVSACSFPKPKTIPASVPTTFDQDLQLRKPELSRVGEGEGVKLSEAIQKNLKEGTISAERLQLIKFIASSRKPKHEECVTQFNNAPECRFLKEGWADTYYFEDQSEQPDGAEAEMVLKVSQRTPTVKMTKGSKRKHNKSLELLKRDLMAGKFEKVPGQI